MTNSYCKKCGQCCRNIVINKNTKKLCRDGIQDLPDGFEDMLIFQKSDDMYNYYSCKYLQDDLCTNPVKPNICTEYPSNAFAFLQENCGYYGIIFQKREAVKQKVRKLKEEIIHYNALIATTLDKSQKKQYMRIIESHERFISKYAVYNSEEW